MNLPRVWFFIVVSGVTMMDIVIEAESVDKKRA
jgi:hypothetical protein